MSARARVGVVLRWSFAFTSADWIPFFLHFVNTLSHIRPRNVLFLCIFHSSEFFITSNSIDSNLIFGQTRVDCICSFSLLPCFVIYYSMQLLIPSIVVFGGYIFFSLLMCCYMYFVRAHRTYICNDDDDASGNLILNDGGVGLNYKTILIFHTFFRCFHNHLEWGSILSVYLIKIQTKYEEV